jgi:hypothetical protein
VGGFPQSVPFHHCSVLTVSGHVAVASRTNGRSMGTFHKSVLFGKDGSRKFQLVSYTAVSFRRLAGSVRQDVQSASLTRGGQIGGHDFL